MQMTGKGGRKRVWRAVLTCLVFSAGFQACVKRTVSVPVPPKYKEAKTATFDEVLKLLDHYADGIQALASSTMRVTFTSGRIESGKLQEYRSAPGYILLKRPDLLRMNIQNPVTKTTILELLSRGDSFSIWYPRENKFFTGNNSVKEFDLEGQPSFTVRPIHLFQAILPQSSTAEETQDERVAFEESQDAVTKYYVLSYYRVTGGMRLVPLRRLWIDRSAMAVARLETFSEEGVITSTVRYSSFVETNGFELPLTIKMERPVDEYMLDMQFREWRVNPQLPENAFVLNPPEGAERVELKPKGRSGQN